LVFVGLAFVVLAVAVAAKIYPLVLFPLFFVVALKRLGASALVPAILFPILVAFLLWPILSHLDAVKDLQQYVKGAENRALTAPPPGIEAFARHWEYGDKPEDVDRAAPDQPSRIWFVKTSNKFRHETAESIANTIPTVDKRAAPFWLTRMTTLAVFGFVVLWGCVRLIRSNDPRLFLEIVFLTIAWFWLLAPTAAIQRGTYSQSPRWRTIYGSTASITFPASQASLGRHFTGRRCSTSMFPFSSSHHY